MDFTSSFEVHLNHFSQIFVPSANHVDEDTRQELVVEIKKGRILKRVEFFPRFSTNLSEGTY